MVAEEDSPAGVEAVVEATVDKKVLEKYDIINISKGNRKWIQIM